MTLKNLKRTYSFINQQYHPLEGSHSLVEHDPLARSQSPILIQRQYMLIELFPLQLLPRCESELLFNLYAVHLDLGSIVVRNAAE
jgi:hypothetical protein